MPYDVNMNSRSRKSRVMNIFGLPGPKIMKHKFFVWCPRCKALDAAASGYVRAEAVGAVLLELVEDSSSGFLALISGSGVNQDGRSSGLTAPNGPAQQAIIKTALGDAVLQPSDLAALQMHGTGMSSH